MQDDAANRSPTAAIAALHSGVWSSSSTDGVPRGVTGSKRTLDASIVGESGASTGALASAFVAASIAAFTSKAGSSMGSGSQVAGRTAAFSGGNAGACATTRTGGSSRSDPVRCASAARTDRALLASALMMSRGRLDLRATANPAVKATRIERSTSDLESMTVHRCSANEAPRHAPQQHRR